MTEKVRAPIDQYKDVELGPLPPIAPDGGFMPGGVGQPPPVPKATPENFVCLRGPCRHYWELETWMAAGNPAATFGPDGLKDASGAPLRPPRQINRTCLVHPGTETELTEDCVLACSRWDPLSPRELAKRLKARDRYFREHPEHKED